MNEIEEIKGRLDLVDLISQYVTLKKAGANYKGVCPFHQEKTPSLMVSPQKQIWKCFGCFPPGQLIKTPFGFHRIEDLVDDHPIISGQGEFRKIITTHKRSYRGQIIHIKTRKLKWPISATADHNFLVVRSTAKHEARNKYFAIKIRRYEKYLHTNPEYYYRKIEKWLPIHEIKASDLRSGDCLLYPINERITTVSSINLEDYVGRKASHGKIASVLPNLPIDDRLLKLLGYWIAEGSSHRAYIRFSLGNHELEFAEEIVALIGQLFGIKATIHQRAGIKTGVEVTACHAGLAQAFTALCGQGAASKHIPFILQESPIDEQLVILKAIAKGDGHLFQASRSDKIHQSIITVSSVLAEQITDVCLRNGFFPSVHIAEAKKDKNNLNHRESYTVFWSEEARPRYNQVYLTRAGKKYWLLPIEKIRREEYSGPVYNLTVAEDHNYIAAHVAVGNCGRGGDHYRFVMEAEHLEFGDALRLLAQKAGVTLKSRTTAEHQSQSRKELLYRINKLAAAVFQKVLLETPEGKQALDYLKSRQISVETIKKFEIGFASKQVSLQKLTAGKGVSPADLQRAGSPEKFFDRIIFPICDVLGHVIAFTGRALGDAQPKYLNSPETQLFAKSRVLYGLNLAKSGIKKEDRAILVEGQMDVIALHQAGVTESVASSGTAVTEQQLQILSKYTQNFVLGFDNDSAGVSATEKVIQLLLKNDLNGRVLQFSPYKDAGELFEQDPNLWPKTLEDATEMIDWLIDQKAKTAGSLQFIENKKKLTLAILPTLRLVSDATRLDYYIQRLASLLQVSTVGLYSALKKNNQSKPADSNPTKPTESLALLTNEEQLLALFLFGPSTIKRHIKKIDNVVWQSADAELVAAVVKKWYNDETLVKNPSRFSSQVKTDLDSRVCEKIDSWQFWLSAQWPELSPALLEELLQEKFSQLSTKQHDQHKTALASSIQRAQQAGDLAEVKRLVSQLSELTKQNKESSP